ncbi:MAG: hypothetical protein ABIH50_03375 [bacterium]
MPKVCDYLETVDFKDKNFVGTIAFRSEGISLPDGSKMALGIDDGHWVLVYQEKPGAHFQVMEYDQAERKIIVDKKLGGREEIALLKKRVAYFFNNVEVDDLVTLLPPQG